MEPKKICSDLVALRSENPLGDTSGPIEYIRDFLEARGIGVQVICTRGAVQPGDHRETTTAHALRACGRCTGP